MTKHVSQVAARIERSLVSNNQKHETLPPPAASREIVKLATVNLGKIAPPLTQPLMSKVSAKLIHSKSGNFGAAVFRTVSRSFRMRSTFRNAFLTEFSSLRNSNEMLNVLDSPESNVGTRPKCRSILRLNGYPLPGSMPVT